MFPPAVEKSGKAWPVEAGAGEEEEEGAPGVAKPVVKPGLENEDVNELGG